MRILKLIGLALILVLVGIQLIPTSTNQSTAGSPSDFVTTYKVPENIGHIINTSCYNCHSNNTIYPWYGKVQPVGWFLGNHINKGKEELNFSEFGTYSDRKKNSKFKSMVSQIENGEMPLPSYTFIHREARLSPEDKKVLIDYLNALIE